MPHTSEEREKGTFPRSRSLSIVVWWKKFHFSGRVIMCSVLFGLGLVLIGGLILAINMDESNNDSDNLPEEISTKAPSTYVGPVIMGVGGFIVTVGVIMCLFETQVCRKRSGDASPLISDKTDPEGSDSVAVPSSSKKSHHKHGRKVPASPRKSKSKHGKSHSKDKDQEKWISPRTPPITIDKSKSFMTSSEDKFLTPPNGPNSPVEHNSEKLQSPASSSLMKSFTSSGPSWNQSTEFLTPSTSFRDTSVSLTSSVEVDEKQVQVNFKSSEEINPEYMTPLTVEEDRIQKLLMRVKNEQAEVTKKEMEEKSKVKLNVKCENEVTRSPSIENETVMEDIKISQNIENENVSTDALPHAAPLGGVSGLDNISQTQTVHLKNVSELSENENIQEGRDFPDECANTKPEAKIPVENVGEKEISHMSDDINVGEKSNMQEDKRETSSVSDASVLVLNENKLDLDHQLNKNIAEDDTNENELENSVSSDETVVSPDNFVDTSKNVESDLTKNPNPNSHSEAENALKSLSDVKPVEGTGKSDPQDLPTNVTDNVEVDSNHSSHGENDIKIDTQKDIDSG